jgi:pre-rRNA-processing protein TSR2
LRIAIEQGWGGPHGAEKSRWLASVIVDAFEQQVPLPDAIYVEEMLLQIMEDEFDTAVEDSSTEAVADDIVNLWNQVHMGRQDMVLKFEQQSEKVKGTKLGVQEVANDDDDDDEWEDGEDESEDDDDAPTLLHPPDVSAKEPPEVDEDGFTTVKKKGQRRS